MLSMEAPLLYSMAVLSLAGCGASEGSASAGDIGGFGRTAQPLALGQLSLSGAFLRFGLALTF